MCSEEDKLMQSTIDDVCRYMNHGEKEQAAYVHGDYVPDENISLDDKIAYIVCAIPRAAFMPTPFIVAKLLSSNTYVIPKDYPYTKPKVADAFMKIANKNELNHFICSYKETMRCPQRYKDDDKFVLILMIAEFYELWDTDLTNQSYEELYGVFREYCINAGY